MEILDQGTKVKSTTSMGVIGECLSGLFACSGIEPWPIVRVINRWPDFIFYDRLNSSFALLESKAFSNLYDETVHLENRISKPLIDEFLHDALHHLVYDRSASVWGAFTCIDSVIPFQAKLTFVETSLIDKSTDASKSPAVPKIGELVLQTALNKVVTDTFRDVKIKSDRNFHLELNKKLKPRVKESSAELEKAMEDAILQFPNSAISNKFLMDKVKDEGLTIWKKHSKRILSKIHEADPAAEYKMGFSTDDFEEIRDVGIITLLGRRLSDSEARDLDKQVDEMRKNQLRDWSSADKPFFHDSDGNPVYRCGGLLIKKVFCRDYDLFNGRFQG